MTALHAFLTTPVLGTSAWLWLVVMAIVIGLPVLDLWGGQRHDREIEMRELVVLHAGARPRLGTVKPCALPPRCFWRWC